jgi:hypothetical protein
VINWLLVEREALEREWMTKADSESKAYERETKYQLEEKERREWEQEEVNKWESQLEKNKKEWSSRMREQNKVK